MTSTTNNHFEYIEDLGGEDEKTTIFNYPTRRLNNSEVSKKFKTIDFKNTKMNHLDNGEFVFIYAMGVIKTKFGECLYSMDYEGRLYKMNKRNTDIFNSFNDRLEKFGFLMTNDEPMAVIKILEDAEYMGHPYKIYDLVYIERGLKYKYDEFKRDEDRQY